MREYASFSWPLFAGALMGVALVQAPAIASARFVGVTGVAAIALATVITQFSSRVDDIVTQTLYPAICAVKDRPELLYESFWKSNRLALLWATPVGAAAALFAGDFVGFVLGERWRYAVPLLALFGVAAALNQIAFNWTAFYRAIGDTRPIAAAGGVGLVGMLLIAVPLLVLKGLAGFGVGMVLVAAIGVAIRVRYLRRLFPGFPLTRHIARGIGPTLPAVGAVLGVRAMTAGPRTLEEAIAEAVLFVLATAVTTFVSERELLRELWGYLSRRALAGQAHA